MHVTVTSNTDISTRCLALSAFALLLPAKYVLKALNAPVPNSKVAKITTSESVLRLLLAQLIADVVKSTEGVQLLRLSVIKILSALVSYHGTLRR